MFPGSSLYTSVWRAGRECASGNIANHSLFTNAFVFRSFAQTVILMMSSVVPPAHSITRRILANITAHCSSSPSGAFPVAGSLGKIPLLMTREPIRVAAGIGFSCSIPATSKLRRLLTVTFLLSHVFIRPGHNLTHGSSGFNICNEIGFTSGEFLRLRHNGVQIPGSDEYDAAAVCNDPVSGIHDSRSNRDWRVERCFNDATAGSDGQYAASKNRESKFAAFIDVAADSVDDRSRNFLHSCCPGKNPAPACAI